MVRTDKVNQADRQRTKPPRRRRKKRRGTGELLLAFGLFAASALCLATAFAHGYDGRSYLEIVRTDLDAASRLRFAGYLAAGVAGLGATFWCGRRVWMQHQRRGGRTAAMLAIIAAMAVLVRMFSSI